MRSLYKYIQPVSARDLDATEYRLNAKLKALEDKITKMEKKMAQLDDAITALTAKVTLCETEIDGATTFINGVPALIKTAVDAALALGATPAQLQALTDLGNGLAAKGAVIAAAVVAGTASEGQVATVPTP